MLQTVYVYKGKLSIGLLEFQLTDENGNPSDITFRGEGSIQGNALRILQGRTGIYDFTIAEKPTQESLDYSIGYDKALSQKRKRLPNNYTSHYYYGWLAGWESKKGQ